MRAARMLSEAVEKYLRESKISVHRVVVRVYADVKRLSKLLSRPKLIDLDGRSFAPFAAGFTRAINFFDFVDALDEEGTKFKIRGMRFSLGVAPCLTVYAEHFKMAVQDSSCSHILYAACHDSSYLAGLVPYSGLMNKITLVQGADFDSGFHQSSLAITQFPTIFRWSRFPSSVSSSERATPTTPYKSPKAVVALSRNWCNTTLGTDDQFLRGDEDVSGTDKLGARNAFAAPPKMRAHKPTSQIPCRFFVKVSSRHFCI